MATAAPQKFRFFLAALLQTLASGLFTPVLAQRAFSKILPKPEVLGGPLPGGEQHLQDLIPCLTYFLLSISPGLSWVGGAWNGVWYREKVMEKPFL